ncbi:hypothetical protein [Salibacterium qingdaonense]|uniref:Uncharacterized protein n=1 Tax=Salibacterium qingdaonense TaxID=266892 RepID=A0A1I4Q956_9BACI|nr:hypothetical protein [Salibacterium qingdaonense]SFM36205.1 hypothetical protein SAMN04488054_1381 [Salibacterium qingdaonense]
MDTVGFKDAVQTLKLYHRIKNNDFNVNSSENSSEDNQSIEKLYVDLLPNDGILEEMMNNETTFLIGRKGTGKSTIISRAQQKIRQEKNQMSVYINAKSVHEMSKVSNLTTNLKAFENVMNKEDIRKLLLLRNFLDTFAKSLNEELKSEEHGFFEGISNKFRDFKLDKRINDLHELINNPELLSISDSINKQETTSHSNESINELKFALQTLNPNYKGQYKEGNTEKAQYTNVLAKYFNIGSIIENLNEIVRICDREKLYVFIDPESVIKRVIV